jgi:hypothetical protein
MSPTGVPAMADDATRIAAAIALYDEALGVAPLELHDDLRTMQDGFRNQTNEQAAGDRLWQYNLTICGADVYLGSLD